VNVSFNHPISSKDSASHHCLCRQAHLRLENHLQQKQVGKRDVGLSLWKETLRLMHSAQSPTPTTNSQVQSSPSTRDNPQGLVSHLYGQNPTPNTEVPTPGMEGLMNVWPNPELKVRPEGKVLSSSLPAVNLAAEHPHLPQKPKQGTQGEAKPLSGLWSMARTYQNSVAVCISVCRKD